MAINLYQVHDAERRAAAHAAYVGAPEFSEIEKEADRRGFRHAGLGEIEASAQSAPFAPELYCWRGGLWVAKEGPPFTCKFCGVPSWVDPSDQSPPPDYCHPSDHGEPN